jgi:hypothetical protein
MESDQYYYSSATGAAYSAYEMQALFGYNVETTDVTILNANGFYPVQPSSPDFDVALYNPTFTWSIVSLLPTGEGAVRVFTATAKPLAEAKEGASVELKTQADQATQAILTNNSLSVDVISAVASQAVIDRPAFLTPTLDELVAVSDQLGADLAAVDACTTVDEINNIVKVPGGILFTGRGAGLGPEDLNVSYYNEFNSVSMTESETELYVPGTATVIAYGSGGPNQFDSFGNCFNPGDYLMQIREVATSRVIAEFECPLNPAGEDVAF